MRVYLKKDVRLNSTASRAAAVPSIAVILILSPFMFSASSLPTTIPPPHPTTNISAPVKPVARFDLCRVIGILFRQREFNSRFSGIKHVRRMSARSFVCCLAKLTEVHRTWGRSRALLAPTT